MASADQFGNFSYTSDGTTISITGYTGAGGTVTIPAAIVGLPVRSIWTRAFYQKSTITYLSIPNSVTYIGESAFHGCTGLINVSVSDGVITIDNYAFTGCTSLTSLTIPNSVTSIGNYVLQDCTSLTGVTIGNSVKTIGMRAFRRCRRLTSVIIPDSVTSMEGSADRFEEEEGTFSGCTSLVGVTISNSLVYIGNGAFRGCSGLTSVTIPSSVTSLGSHAFRGCSRLTSVTIPNNVTWIGRLAFDSCTGLTNVSISNGVNEIATEAFAGCTSLSSVTIPNSVISIGARAFYRCTRLMNAIIPASVIKIGGEAFSFCANLLEISVDAVNTSYSSVNGVLLNKNQTVLIQYPGAKAGSYTIPSSVFSIESNAFIGCTRLTSLTIPNSVTAIEIGAFSGCTGLTSVTIPDSVSFIGGGAFAGCTKLTSVTIPRDVTIIKQSTFSGCTDLNNVSIPNGVIKIESEAFAGCGGLTSVTIPDGVNFISSGAFQYCNRLSIALFNGNAPSAFDTSVFDGASPFFKICYYTGSSGFTAPTWQGYPVVELMTPPGMDGLIFTTDGTVATLRGCLRADSSIVIPSTFGGLPVKIIEKGAFYTRILLTNVVIPNSVTTIEAQAFQASGLTSVTIPNSVTSIEESAFYACRNLTVLTMTGSVASIKNNAFCNCSGLENVTFPSGVNSIGDHAFSGCIKLTSVTFDGNAPALFGFDVFRDTPSEFTIYYYDDSTGFISPSWNGYSAVSLPRSSLAGSIDTDFNGNPGANNAVWSLALQGNGTMLIGGYFTSYNGVVRGRLAKLGNAGSLDGTYAIGSGAGGDGDYGSIRSLTVLPDGKALIGGFFTSYNGIARGHIARLNSDGTLDATFNSGTGANDARTTGFVLQPDGKVLIGGTFTSYNGTGRNRIARLNSDGSLDTSFNPGTGANDLVYTVAVQPDGKVLIGGAFTSYNGTGRNRIARLNSDGSLDTSFNPGTGADNKVYCLRRQPDGKVLVGGTFTSYNGTARVRLARLNSDGSVDTGFDPGSGANEQVTCLALQADGKVLIGGYFSTYRGVNRNRIARVNSTGNLDTGFQPGSGAGGSGDYSVSSVALQPDGRVLISGNFTSYNGMSRNRLARLLNYTANQSLAVINSGQVRWLRAGASPEVEQVHFEYSAEGMAWTPLGNGTRIQTGWELTGLSLPTSGHIRSRGRASCGQYNGSSSIIEQTIAYSLPLPLEMWRVQHFGVGVTNTGLAADDADPDGDGFTNAQEYAADSDPKNSSSRLRIEGFTKATGSFSVTMLGRPGRIYSLQRMLSTNSAVWHQVGNVGPLSNVGTVILTDPSVPSDSAFYRVRVTTP